MKAKLTTRIDTIDSILNKLTRPVKGLTQQQGTEINAFQEDKVYLEIGLNARVYKTTKSRSAIRIVGYSQRYW